VSLWICLANGEKPRRAWVVLPQHQWDDGARKLRGEIPGPALLGHNPRQRSMMDELAQQHDASTPWNDLL
jgi:hypothetical protein